MNGRLYALTVPMRWQDAEAEAQRVGGHLATVRSQEEHDWLMQQFGSGNYWIGLNDEAVEGTFEWSSGEPVTYTNWCPGQPDASTPDEDYVHMANYPGWCLGGWNDQQGTDTYVGIIERPFRASDARVLRVGGPGGYTLQAALDAALPGDVIELHAHVQGRLYTEYRVDKSVTIDGAGFGITASGLYFERATPGIPVIVRNLYIDFWDTGYGSPRNEGWVFGCHDPNAELRIEDAYFNNLISDYGPFSGGFAVDVSVHSLWMRHSCVYSGLPETVNACSDWRSVSPDSPGAMRIQAQRAFVEGCEFYGADGQDIEASCGAWVPNCPFIVNTQAGNGGAGLDMGVHTGALVNCTIVDGREGRILGSCPGYSGSTGSAGRSSYNPSDVVDGGLSTSGTFAQGGEVHIRMQYPVGETWWAVVGVGWAPLQTSLGVLHTLPWDAFPLTRVGWLTLPIPNTPGIRGLDVVVQAVRTTPSLALGNPSAVYIH